MKFAVNAVLLASVLGAAMAQDSSSSSAAPSSTSVDMSSSSAPASSSSSGATSAPAGATATCILVSGDPRAQAFGCPQGATTVTPPYNSESLASYLIGGYSHGKEGEPISEVASDLANSVTALYPTLTDYSAIVTQYVQALNSKANIKDAGSASFHVPSGLASVAAVAVALVAGGAFIL